MGKNLKYKKFFFKDIFQLVFFLLVRLFILALSCYLIAFTVCYENNLLFLINIIPLVIILAETIYIAVWRRSKDRLMGRDINWYTFRIKYFFYFDLKLNYLFKFFRISISACAYSAILIRFSKFFLFFF